MKGAFPPKRGSFSFSIS